MQAAEPDSGDGHHLHPDGARLRLSDGGARLVRPPHGVMAAVDHNGRHSAKRRFKETPQDGAGSSRQAGQSASSRSNNNLSGTNFTCFAPAYMPRSERLRICQASERGIQADTISAGCLQSLASARVHVGYTVGRNTSPLLAVDQTVKRSGRAVARERAFRQWAPSRGYRIPLEFDAASRA
jgi:hypothetical protein